MNLRMTIYDLRGEGRVASTGVLARAGLQFVALLGFRILESSSYAKGASFHELGSAFVRPFGATRAGFYSGLLGFWLRKIISFNTGGPH